MERKKLKILITALVIIILIAAGFLAKYYLFQKEEEKGFELDTLFLKVAINQGGSSVNNVKIINTGKKQTFLIKVIELDDLIKPEETSVELDPQEDYSIKLIVNGKDKEPGVYLGELEISAGNKQKIPIILEIQSKEVLFDSNVNLYPQGRDLIPGEKLNAEIKIFDLAGIGRDNVRLTYFIKSFDDRTLVSASEDLVVDGKLDYSRSLDLPKNLRLGNYVFITTTKYKESFGTASVFFKVVEFKEESSSSNNLIIIIITLFSLFFLVFLSLFLYSMFYKDKLLIELQNQYKRELRRQRELIENKEKIGYTKLRGEAERKEYKREIEKIKKQRLKELANLQDKRVKEYNHIKKKSKGNQLKKQLNAWRKKGYNTSVLERKYRIPKAEDIKKKVAEWKRKGYDISVLEKRIKK